MALMDCYMVILCAQHRIPTIENANQFHIPQDFSSAIRSSYCSRHLWLFNYDVQITNRIQRVLYVEAFVSILRIREQIIMIFLRYGTVIRFVK